MITTDAPVRQDGRLVPGDPARFAAQLQSPLPEGVVATLRIAAAKTEGPEVLAVSMAVDGLLLSVTLTAEQVATVVGDAVPGFAWAVYRITAGSGDALAALFAGTLRVVSRWEGVAQGALLAGVSEAQAARVSASAAEAARAAAEAAVAPAALDAATAARINDAASATRAALSSTYRTRAITVGVGKDYATIQEAIDNAGDSFGLPVTIYVDPGTYGRFSMVGWPNQTGVWTGNRLRYISIIGRGEAPSDVVVLDTTGDYRTPPAEIRTHGLIKNLTFLANHDTPFVDPVESALARRSYAVHLDFGGEDVLFEDCRLISYHSPAAGIGLHANERVTFRRCTLTSYADGTYGGLINYGALFAHSNSGNYVPEQHLILDQVDALCANGDRAIWLSIAGSFIGSQMTVEALGVNAYCSGATPVVRDARITVTPDSGNNNSSVLVPTTWPAQMAGLALPGTTTDYLITPDTAALDITGDLELIWYGSLADWSSGQLQGLMGKYEGAGDQRSYGLSVNATGALYLTWTTAGTSASLTGITCSAPVPFANGAAGWVKATLDVDDGAGNKVIKFYTSTDGTTWSPLGTTSTAAGVTRIHSGTAPLKVGIWSTYVMTGTVRRAIVKDGIDGSVVADWDGRVPATRYRDVAGRYWTIVGGGSSWAAA